MFEEIIPLESVHFFALQLDCLYAKEKKLDKKHMLPNLSSFYAAKFFAEVSLGWHEKGIYVIVAIDGCFDKPDFPYLSKGDSIELFFDTRDVKTSGYTTRFCHHFYFLPDAVETNGESVRAGEITRFRTDDVHELCDSSLLQVESKLERKKSVLKIFIPSECLHGYDPHQFDRMGFTYRINRVDGTKQTFSASEADVVIENQPSLWASIKLAK